MAAPHRLRRIVSVIGTRPEAIKMAPVVRALATLPSARQILLLTGQHCGLERMFDFLPNGTISNLAVDPRGLGVEALRAAVRTATAVYLSEHGADLVLVHGDTTSALGGALAAHDCGLPIGHVEAGLRSFSHEPWPEEENRVAIDALSDLLFAPTQSAADNLAADANVRGTVHITGNSGIDALLALAIDTPPVQESARKMLLVTCHRRENQGAVFERVCGALRQIVADFPVQILFALHTNTHLRAAAERCLGGHGHIALAEPVDHPGMAALMRRCWAILTDSGGLQEEGPAIGRPVLVLRDVTERREAVDNVQLVGTDPNIILAAVHRLLMDDTHYAHMAAPRFPFGDGHAAPRMAAHIADWFAGR